MNVKDGRSLATLVALALACVGPVASLQGCAGPARQPDSGIVAEGVIKVSRERTYEALKATLADKGASVLFARADGDVVVFEWPSAPGRTARARTVAKLSPVSEGTRVHLRTSGYLPTSDPPEISLGLEVGPQWIGCSDDSVEVDLLKAIDLRSQRDQ